MQPTRNLVLIEADKPQEKTASGLYVQESWKTLPLTGTVLSVGADVTVVKSGDRVVFDRFGSIKVEGQKRFCTQNQIFAIITNEKS